ncbi:hypothetical protein EUTSA_v100292110mg, partial [Eutrema salsugineum]
IPDGSLVSLTPTDSVQAEEMCEEAHTITEENETESGPAEKSAPLLQSAWTKKLNLSIASASHQTHCTLHNPVTMEDNLRFPWAAKMNPTSRNLYRAAEPDYLDDGTPKVTIPQHVLLRGLENQKEYIL